MENRLVPAQKEGGQTGATSTIRVESPDDARVLFDAACVRLLNVNKWYAYAGRKGAKFQLTDSGGNSIQTEKASSGQLIRIEIPGPGNKDGDSYDWVIIEKAEESGSAESVEQSLGFRVRPVENPRHPDGTKAHFYTGAATSTFLICRNGNTVSALERGRNEKPNLHGGFLTKVRNFFVGLGAALGLSVPAWKLWAESMLEPKDTQKDLPED